MHKIFGNGNAQTLDTMHKHKTDQNHPVLDMTMMIMQNDYYEVKAKLSCA